MRKIDKSISEIDLWSENAQSIQRWLESLPLPRFVYFGDIDYIPGGQCGPRLQTHVQIVTLSAGRLELQLDTQLISLKPGQMCLTLPGEAEHYRFDATGPSTHQWLDLWFMDQPDSLLTDEMNSTDWQQQIRTLPRCVDIPQTMMPLIQLGLQQQSSAIPEASDLSAISTDKSTEASITASADSWVWRQIGRACLMSYIAAALQEVTLKQDASQSHRSPVPQAVLLAEHYLAAHYIHPLMLDDLAHAANVSGPHLVRLFRQHRNTTPMRALWDYRVDRGLALLRDTGLTIVQIAERVGFTNPYHFSRLVKIHTGLSPSVWRKQVWSGK